MNSYDQRQQELTALRREARDASRKVARLRREAADILTGPEVKEHLTRLATIQAEMHREQQRLDGIRRKLSNL